LRREILSRKVVRRMRRRLARPARVVSLAAGASLPLAAFYACTSSPSAPAWHPDSSLVVEADAAPPGSDAVAPDASGPSYPTTPFCQLPGSIVTTASGVSTVPGGAAVPDVSYVHLPPGFCVHYYAQVPAARQLRFAPGGELFVASPGTPTVGGGTGGLGAIQVVPDDNHDGVGDSQVTFLANLTSTQGLLFAPGVFYYQDGVVIRQLPYATGQRSASGTPTTVMTVVEPQTAIHWPKVLEMADDGTIYVTNGGGQTDVCVSTRPFLGGILKVDGTPNGAEVAKGYRNPIALRCHHGFGGGACVAAELALDDSAAKGGREKLTSVQQGADYGFPCCATANLPYGGVTYADTDGQAPDCSHVAAESNAFLISQTPFGLDFAPTSWPAPYSGSVFVALHGTFGTWLGERLVAIRTDPTTGLPLPSAEDAGASAGNQSDFATGWDGSNRAHGRPAAVTFSPDGRLFLANDVDGTILWIAPVP
jgi:glucose/arabinose dehydrogenase